MLLYRLSSFVSFLCINETLVSQQALLPNSRFPLISQSNKRNLERLYYIWVVVVVVVVVRGDKGREQTCLQLM